MSSTARPLLAGSSGGKGGCIPTWCEAKIIAGQIFHIGNQTGKLSGTMLLRKVGSSQCPVNSPDKLRRKMLEAGCNGDRTFLMD